MGLLLRKMVLIMTSPIDYTINQKEISIKPIATYLFLITKPCQKRHGLRSPMAQFDWLDKFLMKKEEKR